MLSEMIAQDMDGWPEAFEQAQGLVKKGKITLENYQQLLDETREGKPLYYANIQVRAYEIFGSKLDRNQKNAFLVDLFDKTGLFGLHAYFCVQLANGKEKSDKLQRKLTDLIELVNLACGDKVFTDKDIEQFATDGVKFVGKLSSTYATLRLAFLDKVLRDKPDSSALRKQTAAVYAAYFNARNTNGSSMDRAVTLMKQGGCEIKASNAASAVQAFPELANKEKARDAGNGSSSTVVRRTYTITAPISAATTNAQTQSNGNVSTLTALFEEMSKGKAAAAPTQIRTSRPL